MDASVIDIPRLAETATLFGTLLATLLALFLPIAFLVTLAQRLLGPERLRRWLGGRRSPAAIGKGLALGAVTPFCTCSTIPLLAGLIRARVRFAAVTAFFMASPLLSPFVVAAIVVLFTPAAAIAYGLFAMSVAAVTAAVWERLRLDRWLRRDVPQLVPVGSGPADLASTCSTSAAEDGAACGRERATGDPPGQVVSPAWLRAESRAAAAEAWALLRPMLRPLLLGVAVGALVYGVVPAPLLVGAVEAAGPAAVPVAAVLGIPLYVRGTVALPIGAGLLGAGVPAGPVLALVVGGMAASLPEMIMLRGLFTRRLLTVYLVTVFAVAVAAGTLLPLAWQG